MADSQVIVVDSAMLADDDGVTERWNTWQQRRRVLDARNGRRMGILAIAVALALAGMVGWLALGVS